MWMYEIIIRYIRTLFRSVHVHLQKKNNERIADGIMVEDGATKAFDSK